MNIPSINSKVGNLLNKGANLGWIHNKLQTGFTQPAKFAATLLVTSIVSKDLVGCVLYTYQSATNKKIPEEKRKFVASLDLMNGIIMVGGQFMIGKIIDKKLTPRLLAHYTGILKDKDTKEETLLSSEKALSSDRIAEKIKKYVIENKSELKAKGLNAEELTGNVADFHEFCKTVIKKIGKDSPRYKALEVGFGILMTALATTALTKRVLAPLFATPLAGWFKNRYLEKKKKPDPELDKIIAQQAYMNNKAPDAEKSAFKSMA